MADSVPQGWGTKGARVNLTLRPEYVCTFCGRKLRGLYVNSFRLSKGGLRSTGVALIYSPDRCDLCRNPLLFATGTYHMDDADKAKVNAVRVKRGWEPWTDGIAA